MNLKKALVIGLGILPIFTMAGPTLYAHEDKMNSKDVELARKVHQDLAADRDFSQYAQNIKVVVLDGKVILKGKVENTMEQKAVIDKVSNIDGVTNVVSKLDVKPNPNDKEE